MQKETLKERSIPGDLRSYDQTANIDLNDILTENQMIEKFGCEQVSCSRSTGRTL